VEVVQLKIPYLWCCKCYILRLRGSQYPRPFIYSYLRSRASLRACNSIAGCL